MGSSPSKNDPLPNTSNMNATDSGLDVATGDFEADEPNLSALSHPTGNDMPPHPHFDHIAYDHKSPHTRRNGYEMPFGALSVLESSAAASGSRAATGSSPRAIPTSSGSSHSSKRRHAAAAARRGSDYTLEIDAAMARLVLPDRPPTAGLDSEQDLALSLESQQSDNFSVLPVFTLCDKVESLILSLTSFSSVALKGFNLQNSSPLQLSLAPIVEVLTELTPDPPLVQLASPMRSVASAVVQSQMKPIAKRTGRKPSNSGSKTGVSSASSSLLSLSPPSSTTIKLDFDIDDVIKRLVSVGKRGISSRSSDRRAKHKLAVTAQEIKLILARSRSIFMDQPTLLKLSPPVKIVGDIHGQFFDLIRIFNCCGYPPRTNYLFLGDYVDRGYKSLELILLLLCYKIKYPENFFMLRGNHECANITKIYGFYDECKRRLSAKSGSHKLWRSFIDVFNTLPITAIINDKIFCIHGGLSPELTSLQQIQQIQRPTDIPDRGLLADLLWSDPDPLVRLLLPHVWPKNDRGVSYCFGKKHVDHFLDTYNMDLIVRGHMVVEDGYEFFHKRKLVTVFLAPNYCGKFNNFGAVMSVDRSLCCSFELIKP